MSTVDLPALLGNGFPLLDSLGYTIVAQPDPRYNCIAWAADCTSVCWWPTWPGAFWPEDAPREETIAAFHAAFAAMEYTICDSPEPENGFDKVTIYTLGQIPKHAAKQLPCGDWTSKLGKYWLIAHPLRALVGPKYGEVHSYMKRSRVRVDGLATPA